MALHPLARVPAFRRIETDSREVFAIEIRGEVTSADVENLYGLLEGAYALSDRLDLFVRLADYRGFVDEGVSGETTREVKEHARDHVTRCATVGGSGDLSEVASFLRLPSNVEHKSFAPDEEAAAWDWLGAREVGA